MLVEVSKEYIKKGNEIMENLGIESEYSGSSASGLLYQKKNKIRKDAKILVINTGKAKI